MDRLQNSPGKYQLFFLVSLLTSCASPVSLREVSVETPVERSAPSRDSGIRTAAQDASVVVSDRCAGWEPLGRGIAWRRCGTARSALVLLSGWRITNESTRAWADALYQERLRSLGVRTHFSVEGPEHVDFRGKELAVDALLRALLSDAVASDGRVLVVAHSSGAHVAATMFHRAFVLGRASALRGRVLYVDLDGDPGIASDPERQLSAGSMSGVRRALFVGVEDRGRGLRGLSYAAMESGAQAFSDRAELWVHDASRSGCRTALCVHVTAVNLRPFPRGNESYRRFDEGRLNVLWLSRIERWWE